VLAEIEGLSRNKKGNLQPLTTALTEMAGRVRQMIRQTNARVFNGLTQLPEKIVSLFEPHTEIIRRGTASKPTEFGKLVQVQEAENQIITYYEVFDERPSDRSDRELLLPAVEAHEQILG
jgi:transposase, IS5 family